MTILGLSAFYHDSAAALIEDGAIVAAAQEERFTRHKHDPGFPRHAVEFCLRHASIGLTGVDAVVFCDKPWLKFERLLETYLGFAPAGSLHFSRRCPSGLRKSSISSRCSSASLPRLVSVRLRRYRRSCSPSIIWRMPLRLSFPAPSSGRRALP